jgi:hypothetical protein
MLASDAPTADDDFPAILSPAELRYAVCAEPADEPGANDLRLGVGERHVQNAMAAIITWPTGVLVVLHRTLDVAKTVPTEDRGCAALSD